MSKKVYKDWIGTLYGTKIILENDNLNNLKVTSHRIIQETKLFENNKFLNNQKSKISHYPITEIKWSEKKPGTENGVHECSRYHLSTFVMAILIVVLIIYLFK